MDEGFTERIISPEHLQEDSVQDASLRPSSLGEFVGQAKLKESLSVYLKAAKNRKEPLDHVLLSGPPGLGKTTLASIIANEMGSNLVVTSGPALEKPSELASLLTNLKPRDVLFIDEIHRLRSVVEEYLYPAMEDFKIDIMLESGPGAKSIRLDIKRFTLVGATTRSGLLTSPLRDRFGLSFRLNPYARDELLAILKRSAQVLNIEASPEGLEQLTSRCRGTPRIANRIFRRCRDVAQVKGKGVVDPSVAEKTLSLLAIDALGLDEMDRKILSTLIKKFEGRPVGLTTLGAAVGEDTETLEEVYEPYLIREGLLQRTPRGRTATHKAYRHLGVEPPPEGSNPAGQPDLFSG